jgi:aspartate aminotransferase-like enzyme
MSPSQLGGFNLQLRIPGPTPVPQEVVDAASRDMINHRGPEFAEILLDVTARVKQVFQTTNDLFLLTSSGTGGLEAAVVNTLSPGDRVLGISLGAFGDRFLQIADTYGADVFPMKLELGAAVEPGAVEAAIEESGPFKAVLVTHNETSTGVANDLEAISKVVRAHGPLLLVDAVSSIGSIDLPVDKWGCDVVVTASQKGWMSPPGLSMISFNERAWQANAEAKMPRFYFDLALAKSYFDQGQTLATPAVSIFYALQKALDLIEREGLANVYARHRAVAAYARDKTKELGLRLFAKDERYASDTVTAIRLPAGTEWSRLTNLLNQEFGVVLGGGQQQLKGKICRVGHMGMVTTSDMDEVFAALKSSLERVGSRATTRV